MLTVPFGRLYCGFADVVNACCITKYAYNALLFLFENHTVLVQLCKAKDERKSIVFHTQNGESFTKPILYFHGHGTQCTSNCMRK